MKVNTDWDHVKFISENEKEREILMELYNTIPKDKDVHIETIEGWKVQLSIMTYF